MSPKKIISKILISLLMVSQVSFVALAAETPSDANTSPTTTAQADSTGSSPADSSNPASDSATPADTTTAPSTDTSLVPATDKPADATPAVTAPVTGPAAPTGADPAKTGPTESTGVDKDETGAQDTGIIPDWVFNTTTRQWEEADKSSFKWDARSGYWLSPKYWYDTRIGWYEIVPPAKANAADRPTYLITSPDAPRIISTPIGDFIEGSPEYELAKAMGIIVDPAIINTGPNSTNNANLNNNTTALVDFTNIVRLANSLRSGAVSGDANVSGNTEGADANSGAARTMASVVNLLNSIWSMASGPVVTFVKNIFGNWFGDITITAPDVQNATGTAGGAASTNTTGPNSTNNSNLNNNSDLKVNASNSGRIDNTIDLSANSGNANVSGNTKGGSAVTGDAQVTLNLINMINSAISAGGGFVGIINVFGNLNGDILFSNDFLNKVLLPGASGGSTAGNSTTGPGSANNANVNNNNSLNVNADSQTNINNNLSYNAASGNANVGGNTSAGSASTGEASTHNTLFNLTGQSVAGDNAVLVLVNVMGHWLGGIMNLPAGISSALLGSSNSSATNTNTGPGSVNNSNVNNNNSATVNAHDDMTINNNVRLTAQSGDANVTGNTVGGNAASGKAQIASNVANITNSVLSVKRWFGILIVNVFGDWFGSVGRDTEAGNASVPQPVTPLAALAPVVATNTTHSFNQSFGTAGGGDNAAAVGESVANTNDTNSQIHTLAATNQDLAAQTAQATAASKSTGTLLIIAAVILMMAGALFSVERKLSAS